MEREGRSQQVAGEVRALLARRQISGKQLAAHLGISQFAVSRRLRGQTSFSLDELSAAADFLGVALEDLLSAKDAA
jgi:transcriptional regulator with XRE-family HTH domain